MNSNRPSLVCATNFSDQANEAANVAAKLALLRAENLRLVHAWGVTTTAALVAARKRLEAEAQRLRQTGADVTPLLLEGSTAPPHAISRAEKRLPTSLPLNEDETFFIVTPLAAISS